MEFDPIFLDSDPIRSKLPGTGSRSDPILVLSTWIQPYDSVRLLFAATVKSPFPNATFKTTHQGPFLNEKVHDKCQTNQFFIQMYYRNGKNT